MAFSAKPRDYEADGKEAANSDEYFVYFLKLDRDGNAALSAEEENIISDARVNTSPTGELEVSMDGGEISRFLGVDIVRNEDKSFEFRQPYLIQRILTLLEIDEKVKSRPILVCKPLLHKDKNGDPRIRH